MYYVYILKSKKDKSFYVGYTNDMERRLAEHNKGYVSYTKERIPWNVVYYEAFVSFEDAVTREKSIKHFGKAFSQLKRRIKNSLNR